jgi:hypothetical protein
MHIYIYIYIYTYHFDAWCLVPRCIVCVYLCDLCPPRQGCKIHFLGGGPYRAAFVIPSNMATVRIAVRKLCYQKDKGFFIPPAGLCVSRL